MVKKRLDTPKSVPLRLHRLRVLTSLVTERRQSEHQVHHALTVCPLPALLHHALLVIGHTVIWPGEPHVPRMQLRTDRKTALDTNPHRAIVHTRLGLLSFTLASFIRDSRYHFTRRAKVRRQGYDTVQR